MCRYGLGQIFYRQEKYDHAHHHFRMATSINPRSSVLACYVGMSAHRLGQGQAALDKLQVRPACSWERGGGGGEGG